MNGLAPRFLAFYAFFCGHPEEQGTSRMEVRRKPHKFATITIKNADCLYGLASIVRFFEFYVFFCGHPDELETGINAASRLVKPFGSH